MAAKESRAGSIIEYNDGKLWFHKKNATLTIGITAAALDELGEVEAVSMPTEGEDFDKDDVLCEIDGTDSTLIVYSPAAGFVQGTNGPISDDVQILNEDPIDEGWLVKLEIQDESDIKEYL